MYSDLDNQVGVHLPRAIFPTAISNLNFIYTIIISNHLNEIASS